MDLRHDVRTCRQPVCRPFREGHESVPGSPASDPLAGFLNSEECRADYAAVSRHELQRSKPAFRCQPKINQAPPDFINFRLDRAGGKLPLQLRLAELPDTEIGM